MKGGKKWCVSGHHISVSLGGPFYNLNFSIQCPLAGGIA